MSPKRKAVYCKTGRKSPRKGEQHNTDKVSMMFKNKISSKRIFSKQHEINRDDVVDGTPQDIAIANNWQDTTQLNSYSRSSRNTAKSTLHNNYRL